MSNRRGVFAPPGDVSEAQLVSLEREAPVNDVEKRIHELFEEQVERSPEAIAVEDPEQSVSYGELNVRANRLAHHLRALGVGPDERVAILLERSVELVIAQLAVLKCGAAYVPIDPTFAGERQVMMMADCAARVAITARSMVLPGTLAAQQVEIDDLDRVEAPAGNLNILSDSETAAYVM